MCQLVINKIITFCPLLNQEFYYVMYRWDCEICSQNRFFTIYNRSENVQFLMGRVHYKKEVHNIQGSQ